MSARHWSDDEILKGRAFFKGDSNPGRLVLDNISPQDQGLYKCRVDFASAPTRISNILLDVIVPPEKPRIKDENNEEIRLKLGPYKVGDTLKITCEVRSVRPEGLSGECICFSGAWRETQSQGDLVEGPSSGGRHLHLQLSTQSDQSTCHSKHPEIRPALYFYLPGLK